MTPRRTPRCSGAATVAAAGATVAAAEETEEEDAVELELQPLRLIRGRRMGAQGRRGRRKIRRRRETARPSPRVRRPPAIPGRAR